MLIYVSQESIDKGVQCDCMLCPISIEIQNFVIEDVWVEVGPIGVSIVECGPKPNVTNIELTKDAIEFIMIYDANGPDFVSPFEFELPIPDELLRPEFRSSSEPRPMASSDGYLFDHEDEQ